MNKVILLGRLTRAPELRYSQANNFKVANFTLAVNRKYVKQGEERQTDFINIVAYSKLADFAEKHLKQGIQICICGRIQSRVWNDDNGNKHYVTEVISEEIYFADGPKKADESVLLANTPVNSNPTQAGNVNSVEEFLLASDNLPF